MQLKEVEEQIQLKNGEIRVLRDSLRLANQEKEQQRQAHLDLERDRTRTQSEKEKELSKKVCALCLVCCGFILLQFQLGICNVC